MWTLSKKEIPFVGLHAHSVAGSPFDALGYPQEHMDFAYENGMSALALTDHGNANGLSYQVLHAKKMNEEGKDFKPIYGVEAYFIPSISEWQEEYDRVSSEKKGRKKKEKEGSQGTVIEDETRKSEDILKRRNHLILLAKNEIGLKNIFSLISKSFQPSNFYRFPRLDYDMLSEHSEGVIACSACLGGVYAGDMWRNKDNGPEAVLDAMRLTSKRMLEIFGDDWYAELQWNGIPEQHDLNEYIIKVAQEQNIKLVSTADSHYPAPDAWKDRILYKKLGWLNHSSDTVPELPASVEEVGYELYPKNGEEMWESYKRYSALCDREYDDDLVMDSITRSHEISETKIEHFYPDNTVRLPDFVVPDGTTADQELRKKSIDGLRLLFKDQSFDEEKSLEYVERLKHELSVIEGRGFSKYFLTMKAISDKSTEQQLVGPGRGSAAGSLVSYALGITQVDPIKYGLQFERFLTKQGKGYPDIDYDVSNPMEIKEKLIAEWGENTVVPISNWNTLQLRSLIKDISKFYDIPFSDVNPVTSVMIKEATPIAKKKHGITAGVYSPTWEEVLEYSTTLKSFLKKYVEVETHVKRLVGQVRSCSRHAGGVVIAEDLDKNMPLIYSGGVRQTPWSEGQNVRHLEPMGFIKFDILGLASLRMLEDCIKHVLRRHKGVAEPTFEDVKKFYDENLHPDVIDFGDEAVYKNIFHKGRWAGVFQFTEQGAQSFCKKVKPDNIIDLAAVTSIFRPGPLSAKVDKNYLMSKNSPATIDYPCEEYKEVTEETYGYLIFQEQIALLAHRLGKDLSLDEGNMLRKVLTKKGTGKESKVKKTLYKKFVAGCLEKSITQEKADEIWSNFEFFSGYGFNKSHAVSYSILSYQCAWLLNYYKPEWVAAFLDKEPESRKEKAINIARKMDFKIQYTNVNTSGSTWDILEDGGTLVQPFTAIKGLGDKAVEQIVNNRPFETIEEFLFNDSIVYSKLNKKALDVLSRAGALDVLRDDRFSGAKHFWSCIAADRPKNKKKLHENIELYLPEGEFSIEEKIENMVNLTGVFPMELVLNKEVTEKIDELAIPPIAKVEKSGQVCWFVPREIIPKKTKTGKDYWIVKAVDSTSTTSTIKCWGVRPGLDKIRINRPYLAKVGYSEQWGYSVRSLKQEMKLLSEQ